MMGIYKVKIRDNYYPAGELHIEFIVRAQNEREARNLASKGAEIGYCKLFVRENDRPYQKVAEFSDENIRTLWLNNKWTSCDEITLEGESKIISEFYGEG